MEGFKLITLKVQVPLDEDLNVWDVDGFSVVVREVQTDEEVSTEMIQEIKSKLNEPIDFETVLAFLLNSSELNLSVYAKERLAMLFDLEE